LRALVRGQRGSDLVEYTLLMAFICLAGAAVFVTMAGTTSSLWRAANNQLAAPGL
jgi:Flp pilus assembly pilin Flp